MTAFVDAHVHPPLESYIHGPLEPFLPGLEKRLGSIPDTMDADALAAYYRARGGRGVLFGWDTEWTTGRKAFGSRDVAEAVGAAPDLFVGLGGIDPLKGAAAVGQVHEAARLGLSGIALHPQAQAFDPEGRTTNPVWEAAAEHQMICAFHTGSTLFGSGSAGGGGLRLDRGRPIHVDSIAARLPELRIVLVHGGSLWLDEAVAVALHKSNVFLCIGARRVAGLGEGILEAIRGPLSTRTMLGSGFPFGEPMDAIDQIEKLGLPEDVTDRVLRSNAEALFELRAGD